MSSFWTLLLIVLLVLAAVFVVDMIADANWSGEVVDKRTEDFYTKCLLVRNENGEERCIPVSSQQWETTPLGSHWPVEEAR